MEAEQAVCPTGFWQAGLGARAMGGKTGQPAWAGPWEGRCGGGTSLHYLRVPATIWQRQGWGGGAPQSTPGLCDSITAQGSKLRGL